MLFAFVYGALLLGRTASSAAIIALRCRNSVRRVAVTILLSDTFIDRPYKVPQILHMEVRHPALPPVVLYHADANLIDPSRKGRMHMKRTVSTFRHLYTSVSYSPRRGWLSRKNQEVHQRSGEGTLAFFSEFLVKTRIFASRRTLVELTSPS